MSGINSSPVVEIFYAVYDAVATVFTPPFLFKSEPEAVRTMANCVNQEGHPYWKNPDDYILYKVGTWCPETGMLLALEVPIMVVKAAELVRREK